MSYIGADPELFLEDQTGKVISALGKIGGTKEKPKPIKKLGKGFAVQEDNVLLEYNIPAANTVVKWINHHKAMLDYLAEMVGAQGLKLSTKASHSMDDDQLNHPRAWIFGCEPDYNAWEMKWNAKPECSDPKLRSGGGHVHFSYDDPTPSKTIPMVRMADLFIGYPLMLKDPDKQRQKLYGRPGAFRFKPYGFEYRTPSNYWIMNPHNVEMVYHATQVVNARATLYHKYKEASELAYKALQGNEITKEEQELIDYYITMAHLEYV